MLPPTIIDSLAYKIAAIIDRPNMKWLTVKEACAYAKVKQDVMMRWIKEGHIYAIKKGKWLIDRESIDDFYNSERAILE